MENDKKIAKEIKSHLEVTMVMESCYVVVLAIDKQHRTDFMHKVSTKHGVPMGGYVYDGANETYLVKATDVLSVGRIPFVFKIAMRGLDNWSAEIPIHEQVLRKFLSPSQKADLKHFQTSYPPELYDLEVVQFIAAN